MPKPFYTTLIELGIGTRIIIVFSLVFSVMGGIGLILMKNSLLPTFADMEREVARQKAWRVVSSLEHKMSAIASLNADWAIWDDMYQHMQQRDPVLEQSSFTPESIDLSKFDAILVLNQKNETINFGSRTFSSGTPAEAKELANILIERMARSPVQPKRTECGVARVVKTLSALCWTGVLPSDGSGTIQGVVLMVTELEAAAQKAMSQYAAATFSLEHLEATYTPPPGGQHWQLPALQYLSNTELNVTFSENMVAMQYLLHDVNEKPLAWIRINMDRELMMHGRNVIKEVLLQLATVALVTGLVLLFTVEWWLVLPISRLSSAVTKIGESKQWHTALSVDRKDEIGVLTQGINSLLSALQKQVQALQALSNTDALTGIANRRHFDVRLNDELARLKRSHGDLSLLLLDADHFKHYNDRYGHQQGDALLRQFGTLLRTSCRQNDLAARVGGEEFALILPGTNATGAMEMAERIMAALKTAAFEHDASPTAPIVTVSIGVSSCIASTSIEAASLYAEADKALYAAKQQGRNRACAFSAINQQNSQQTSAS